MSAINFLSTGTYIVLPTKSQPKVYLAITDSNVSSQTFKLYNPFSKKAKILKVVAKFLFVWCNPLAKFFLNTIKIESSDFNFFLEDKLKRKITSSVYIATAKDKLVLQLLDNLDIIGYLKFPITPEGEQRLLNEQKGILTLSKKHLIPHLVLNDTYNGVPFIVLQNLEGSIGLVEHQEYNKILQSFKKGNSFKLNVHPRILELKDRIQVYNLKELDSKLDNIMTLSKIAYLEVFEHGDFAPWNIITTKIGPVPFDFEYFEESGLEYLDEFKYHFQIESLLNKKTGFELIQTLKAVLDLEEFDLLFQVFLIKEIANKYEIHESYNFESSLLKKMLE